MHALASAARRRPAVALLAVGLLALLGYGGYRVTRSVRADLNYRAAQADLQRRDFTAARDHLAACLAERPDDPDALLLAARTARRAGDLAEAERLLDACQALPNPGGALELERALFLVQVGQLDEVEPLLLGHLRDDSPEAALIYEALVPAYLRTFRLQRAFACLERWEKLEPGLALIPLLKGDIYERLRSRMLARDSYAAAVRLDPESLPARLALTRLLVQLRQPEQAWENLQILTARLPDDPQVRRLLARTLRHLGRFDEARAAIDRLLAESPGDGELLLDRGLIELDSGRPQAALDWLRRAEEREPYEREVLFHYARCLEQLGQAEAARQMRERAERCERDLSRLEAVVRQISAEPHSAALRCEAGVILARNGHADEGRRWLESALAEDPRHGPSHLALAEYYEQRGDARRAAEHRRRAERAGARAAPPGPR
jgi:predicted Zn-dependent protease